MLNIDVGICQSVFSALHLINFLLNLNYPGERERKEKLGCIKKNNLFANINVYITLTTQTTHIHLILI